MILLLTTWALCFIIMLDEFHELMDEMRYEFRCGYHVDGFGIFFIGCLAIAVLPILVVQTWWSICIKNDPYYYD